MRQIRNIAIIAHVDHGKTTLVDTMLKQSGTFRDNQQVSERAMDSNDLEKERGITILAKPTSLTWKDIKINIVDTPGHADFGGEVERILSMVDGVVLLVDAAEGPMPQTKFVLSKALGLGLMPIVIINKIDRQDERNQEVVNEIFDLFCVLNANDKQLEYKTLYASGRSGWAVKNLEHPRENIFPLFDTILEEIAEPKTNISKPFSMLVTTREYDQFLGRILTGRVQTGEVKPNMQVKVLDSNGDIVENGRITKLLSFQGLERVSVESAHAGDIVAIAGLQKANVAETIASLEVIQPIPSKPIDPPTLAITLSINDSPLAGKEGSKLTSALLKDRLFREAEGNVAMKITENEDKDAFSVAGRGELQLGVLIETMRREGFELTVSRPRVLFKLDENGEKLEPYEDVQIDVDDEYSGTVIESMSTRKGDMISMHQTSGKTRLLFRIPSRGLIGYHGLFLTETRGTGVMNKIFYDYLPFKSDIAGRRNGALISNSSGTATLYSLGKLEERGFLFIGEGVKVYEGMIVGEHNKENDLDVNVVKPKQLTNIRAAGKDETVRLPPPRILTLEQAIAYIQDDERVEVTPKNIRLRKSTLDPSKRKRK